MGVYEGAELSIRLFLIPGWASGMEVAVSIADRMSRKNLSRSGSDEKMLIKSAIRISLDRPVLSGNCTRIF